LCFKGIDQADDTIKVDSGKKLPLSLRKWNEFDKSSMG
jgi:hypothetical protein